MDNAEMQAKVMAHDAALKALLLTRSDPTKLHMKFNELWSEVVRDLNKNAAAHPENTEMAKALQRECNLMSAYFK